MKKFTACLSAFAIIFGIFSTAAFGTSGEAAIVSSGTDTKIITPADCSDVQSYAANTLRKYIGEITGISLEISSSPEDYDGNKIFVGEREETGVSAKNLSDGGYVLKEKDGDLYIVGSGRRGNVYGVYGFLEKYCGCRWYTKDVKVIPKAESISVPKNLDYTYEPYFEYTDTDWISPRDPEYSMANGLNGGPYRSLTSEQGGTVDYISGFCHTLTTQFCASDKYFDSHPEYFALRGGKRTPNQLCLTNPEVLDIVTREVLDLAAKKWDPSQPLQIISLTQHDNGDYCECEACKKLDEANGSQAGTMITFANKVAKAVKEAGYDNIVIDAFAYQYTRKAPRLVKPEDNVIVRLCSIECCFSHPLNDPECPENVKFMKDLTDWSKICDRLYVWDYVTNFRETANIFPNFKVLQPNIQTFHENGVKGIYEEGNYYMSECDAEFGELRAYLLSKFMRDPYADYDAETDGFLEAYYGAGWKNIREYLDFVCDKAKKNHMGEAQNSRETLPGMKKSDVERCDGLWDKAKALAQNDVYLKRIERSELSWRYWKCVNVRGEFSRLRPCWKWMSEQEKLYNDFVAFGVAKIGEGESHILTECATSYLLRTAEKWRTLYDSKFVFWLAPFVAKFYNFVAIFNK